MLRLEAALQNRHWYRSVPRAATCFFLKKIFDCMNATVVPVAVADQKGKAVLLRLISPRFANAQGQAAGAALANVYL